MEKESKDKVSVKRHIAKTITWRVIGTLDTMIIAWFFTDSISIGAMVGGVEVVTKTLLYFAHERAWYKSSFGRKSDTL
jgi:uncharacterized membrane protein